MAGLVVTLKGIEDVCSREVHELIGADCETEETAVIFGARNLSEECIVAYRAQSALRVMHLLFRFNVLKSLDETLESIKRKVSSSDIGDWLKPGTSFKIETIRVGAHDFKSPEFSAEVGEIFSEFKHCKVRMEGYDVLILFYFNNDTGYCGVDLAGFELAKRDYRIFGQSHEVKAPLAYATLRLAEPSENILDPFCGSGTLAIEAALWSSGKSINFYRKESMLFSKLNMEINEDKPAKLKVYAMDSSMRNIVASKKNSKLAGVSKLIRFSRMDLEWLETKFGKGELDAIATLLPGQSRGLSNQDVAKLRREFFRQATYVLGKEGTISCLSNSLQETPPGLRLAGSREVFSGQQGYTINIFKKVV